MNGTAKEKKPTSAKKRRGRFNFIDLVLILIVGLVVAALFYVFSPESWIMDMIQNQEKTIQYTVEIKNVDEAFLDKIKENDLVSDSVTKSSIGTVTAVDYNTKYTEYRLIETEIKDEEGNPTGEYEYSSGILEYPDRYNVIVTISVTADYSEGEGYSVSSTRIAVGEKMALKFPNFLGEGYCIGIAQS